MRKVRLTFGSKSHLVRLGVVKMAKKVVIDGEHLKLEDVVAVAEAWEAPETVHAELSQEAREKVQRARRGVEELMASGEVVYGVNTGFGHFKDRIIPLEQTYKLQRNIVMSHAVGVGPPLDEATTRALMLIRANSLAKGYSGVRLELLETLLAMMNRGVHPVIPSKGSLGASGDLAPLAHMSLVLIGEGEAIYRGERLPGREAMRRADIPILELAAKEGLSLTNGTAMMTAVGALATWRAEKLSKVADLAGCLSLEALHGTPSAFDERIHAVRPHPRQMECAAYLRRLIEGSQFTRPYDPLNVQDAYTLRCIPQVHGAVRDSILYARWVLEIEMNSATDNPLIFFEEDGRPICLSGGNFHGEIVAIAMDYLTMALTEMGNISERRLTRLTDEASNQETLPAFLTEKGGINSGFMLAQYTAAALASENKVLSHPASVDTIPTSANAEDHVSMGPAAALQTCQVLDNLEMILAIELFAAAQGIDFRRRRMGDGERRFGRGTGPAYALIRKVVPFIEEDTIMYPYIEAVRRLIASGELLEAVEKALVEGH